MNHLRQSIRVHLQDISKYLDNQVPRIRGFSKHVMIRLCGYRLQRHLLSRMIISCSFCQRVMPLSPEMAMNCPVIYSQDGKIFYWRFLEWGNLIYDYLAKTSKKSLKLGLALHLYWHLPTSELTKLAIMVSHGEGILKSNTN